MITKEYQKSDLKKNKCKSAKKSIIALKVEITQKINFPFSCNHLARRTKC